MARPKLRAVAARVDAETEAAAAAPLAFLAAMARDAEFLDALAAWRRDPPGAAGTREHAIYGVLHRFRLPGELAGWATRVAFTGESDPECAREFLQQSAGATAQARNEWFGRVPEGPKWSATRVEFSFPKSWSKTRIMQIVERRWDTLEAHRAVAPGKAGRPSESVTPEQDAEKLIEFDQLVASGATSVCGEGPPYLRDPWLRAFREWLPKDWPHRPSYAMKQGRESLRTQGRDLSTLSSRGA